MDLLIRATRVLTKLLFGIVVLCDRNTKRTGVSFSIFLAFVEIRNRSERLRELYSNVSLIRIYLFNADRG